MVVMMGKGGKESWLQREPETESGFRGFSMLKKVRQEKEKIEGNGERLRTMESENEMERKPPSPQSLPAFIKASPNLARYFFFLIQ